MQRFLRFVSRPGVYIFLVGLVVFAGAGCLWRGMQAPEESGRDGTVARILSDMADLAFEEALAAPVEDGVKQADFALVQAMLRSAIKPEAAVIEATELRHDPKGSYHFQRVRLGVGDDPRPFVSILRDSLKAWADGATLARPAVGADERLWTISIAGIVTHELILTVALPMLLPGTEDKSAPGRILRRRTPGERARLVIVMDDLGEDMNAVRTLARLPYPVTFAVWPRSSHARKAAEAGHAAGREVIIHQPTEPMKYPEIQPGPGALFTSLSDKDIEARVRDSLSRVPYAVGMNNHMGSRFTRDRRGAAAMVRPLKLRGFFVLDSVTHPGSVLYAEAVRQGVPGLKRDVFLDADPSKANVLRQLRKAEKIALVSGSAVAIGHPLPETLAALKEWGEMRNTEVELVRLADLLHAP